MAAKINTHLIITFVNVIFLGVRCILYRAVPSTSLFRGHEPLLHGA